VSKPASPSSMCSCELELDKASQAPYRPQPLALLTQGQFAFAGGRIAQVVEQLTLNQRVVGSSPTAPTKDFNALAIL
jgi:hypothetical protein